MNREEWRSGFTLLELLVVMAIIGILVGILVPVVSGVKKKAKEKQTEAEVQSLALAIRAYHTEYNVWPANPTAGGTWSNENNNVFSNLIAGGNAHNINFIEGSSVTNSSLCDPFGSNRYYVVTISVTNNSVTVKSPTTGFTASY